MSHPLSLTLEAPNGIKYEQPVGLFIDNEFVPAKSGDLIKSICPFNEKEIAQVHAAGLQDVDDAVAAARKAFRGPWAEISATARGELLMKLASLIETNASVLATIEAWDGGKPYASALEGDLVEVLTVVRYYAGYADKMHGQVIETESNQHVYTIREPIGVCGHIIPWNYPLSMAAWKLAPALAAGNTIVLKAAEQTPLSILYFATLIKEAGFPAGVVNIINGYGRVAGAALASHLDIDKIGFTGSTETGKQIQRLAASNLKNITLETGGKSPIIVFEDADLSKAAYWAHIGIMSSSGQMCTANSRIFVQESVLEDFLGLFKTQVQAAPMGDPFVPETFQGPQVSRLQRDRVLEYIKSGVDQGATVAIGGKAWADPQSGKGFFIEPTIFVDVQDDMTIYREEIFGPVAIVASFKSEEEAVRRGNDSQFGLGAAVFTKDLGRAHRIARRIESGTVWINSSNNSDPRVPFGGVKQSGIGRECGTAGIEAYTNIKSVFVTLD
ncbi:aldehyde dehydrogenase domain-containing protein [Ilyonectria destructans]|nr:aldehyde dehydrogenase domain-containing protein [Ilyonectria destructans]